MTDSLLSRRWPWLLAAAIVLAFYFSTIVETVDPEADTRPTGSLEDIRDFAKRTDTNLLFVLIDTLRADRMSMYGYERETTPFLDHVANRGVRFDRNLAQSSWTKSSMASLWTGLYPSRTGVTRFNHALPEDALMPAEIFRENGFQTVGLYRNGWVSGYFGFEQGFDVYAKPTPRKVPPAIRRENPTLTQQGTDMDVVETAVEFLRLRRDDRWMLYLHLMDVHEFVYDIESAIFGTTNSDIYDSAVLHEDYVMETLFAELEKLGLTEKTLIVVASDHGEAFGERGEEGHARSIFRETTEVPLFMSFPFQLEEGVVVTNRTANVDIWPTILELMGLPPLEDEIDGLSRRDEILAGGRLEPSPDAEPYRSFAFLDQNWGRDGVAASPSIAIAEGTMRYVVGAETGKRVESLFDSATDPHELTNLARSQPEELQRFHEIGEQHRGQEPLWVGGTPELEIDEMELNQLRALGYQIP
jgi:arylsulfatase A-like enzyme